MLSNLSYRSMRAMAYSVLMLFVVSISIYSSSGDIIIKCDTIFSEDIIIADTISCVIKPGTVLRFNGYHGIVVRGILVAQGTPEEPIRITAVDREYGSCEPPQWQGIDLRGKNANAVLRHCRIEGAYRNYISNSHPVIENCEFVGNHFAIFIANKSQPQIISCEIYRNKFGLYVDFSTPFLLNTTISDNYVGVHLQHNSKFVAGKNIISGNNTNVRSQTSLGDNSDPQYIKYLWDMMRQLY